MEEETLKKDHLLQHEFLNDCMECEKCEDDKDKKEFIKKRRDSAFERPFHGGDATDRTIIHKKSRNDMMIDLKGMEQ